MSDDWAPMTEETSPGGRKSILVVDADGAFLEAAVEILQEMGYLVLVAQSLQEAKDRFREAPDVVLTDLNVGLADGGLDLVRHVHELQPGIPVVLFSDRPDFKGVTRALREGAFDFIEKPFKRPALKETLEKAVAASVPTIPSNREVVLLDAHDVERNQLQGVLEDAGFSVFGLSTIEEAREIVTQFDVDALLCRTRLGDESGLEFLEEVRERRPGLPVIMVSESPDAREAILSLRAGAFDFIALPADRDELLQSVRRAHEHRMAHESERQIEFERKLYEMKLEKFGQDLDEKMAERTEELERYRRLSADILEAVPSGMILINEAGRVMAVNPSALAAIREPVESVRGHPLVDIQALAAFLPRFELVASRGESIPRGELETLVPGLGRRTFGFTMVPRIDPETGASRGAVVHLKDITDQRLLTAKIQQLEKTSEKEQFLADAGRALTRLITTQRGFLDLLAQRPATVGQAVPALLTVQDGIAALVEERFPQMRARGVESFDLRHVVKEVVNVFIGEFASRHINLLEIEHPGPLIVWGRPDEVRQALVAPFRQLERQVLEGGNLVVRTEEAGGRARIGLKLTGTTEELAELGGTGLAFSRQLLRANRGALDGWTVEGDARHLLMDLPLMDVPRTSRESAAAPVAEDVLVAHGDDLLAGLIEAALEMMGRRTRRVSSASEALAALTEAVPALVVAAEDLQDMDGFRLAGVLAEARPGLPTLVVGWSRPEAGTPHFLRLPFTVEELREAVRKVTPLR